MYVYEKEGELRAKGQPYAKRLRLPFEIHIMH